MGFRFRRRIQLIPGVSLNVSTSGVSLSVLGFNISGQGVSAGFSVPGTGISYRQSLTGMSQRAEREARRHERLQAAYEKAQAQSDIANRLLGKLPTDGNYSVSLDTETGAIELKDRYGHPFRDDEIDLLWIHCTGMMRDFVERLADEFNDRESDLGEIHKLTPAPQPTFTPDRIAFSEPPPMRVEPRVRMPREPSRLYLAPPSLSERWLPWKKRARERQIAELDATHEKNLAEYETKKVAHQAATAEAEAAHAAATADWERKRAEHEASEDAKLAAFQNVTMKSPDAMEDLLEAALRALPWPRETAISLEIAADGALAMIDIDLPEVDEMPQKRAVALKSRRDLQMKQNSERAIRELYV